MSYYGQWGPNHHVDQVLYENFFKNQSFGISVECGAGNGQLESCTKFFEEIGWSTINIEPDKDLFAQVERNRPFSCNINLALSDKDDEIITFDRGPTPGNYSTAKSITWKTLLNQINVFGKPIHKVDLFVLDVEGQELNVIKGMFGSDILPDIICVEYTWDTVGLPNLDKQLGMLGYNRLFLSWNNAFYSRIYRDGPFCTFFGETDIYWNLIK